MSRRILKSYINLARCNYNLNHSNLFINKPYYTCSTSLEEIEENQRTKIRRNQNSQNSKRLSKDHKKLTSGSLKEIEAGVNLNPILTTKRKKPNHPTKRHSPLLHLKKYLQVDKNSRFSTNYPKKNSQKKKLL